MWKQVMETLAATLGELRIAFMGGAPDQVYSNFMKFASKWVMKAACRRINMGEGGLFFVSLKGEALLVTAGAFLFTVELLCLQSVEVLIVGAFPQ